MTSLCNVYLKPGEVHISDRPSKVSTVLGSCVAITMFSQSKGLGGICHALLPRNQFFSEREKLHYVDSSIFYMLWTFESYGVKRDAIEVKLFGGANLFERENGKETVGQSNVEVALDVISFEGLSLIASDVGGTQGRKLFFETHTGRVFLRRLKGIPFTEGQDVHSLAAGRGK
jgi:chemotaxis protein CheD